MPRISYAAKQNALQKAIDKLEKQKRALQTTRRKPVITSIIKSMREYDISPEEIAAAYGSGKKANRAKKRASPLAGKKKVAPKYRHPATGKTWTGRGRTPRWVLEAEKQGKSRESFLIAR